MDRKWWTLIVVCGATFMLLLDVTIVIVALPEIQTGLHASFSEVQWVVDAYALTLASLLLTAGSLADRYGRRLLFTIGLAIFTVGSLTCGLAQSPLMLIISRSVQGVGGAIMFATSLALLAQSFRGKDRGVAFGVWGAITGVAVALGPVLGGVITSDLNWRGIFLVNIPIGVVAIGITLLRVDESKTPYASRPDWAGFVILTAGLVSLVYGLIRASEISWSDTGVEICLALAVVLPRRIRDRRAPSRPPHVRPRALPCAHLLGRADCGLRHERLALRPLALSGAVPAGRSGVFRPRHRRASPAPERGHADLGDGGWAAEHLHARPLAHRSRSGSRRNRLVLDVRSGGHYIVDPPRAGVHRGRLRERDGQPTAWLRQRSGVVRPERSGMASGVNTTFRQIGIAVGIAAYGTIFTASIRNSLDHTLSGVPGLADKTPQIISGIQQGNVGAVIKAAPPSARGQVVSAIHSSFTGALNDLLVVSGILALAGAVGAVSLIRSKDFVAQQQGPPPGGAPDAQPQNMVPAGSET